jgi:hypothetical protein
MTIGNHGSGADCPLWKKIVIFFVAVLIISPILYKLVKTNASSDEEQTLTTSTVTAGR